MKTQEIHELANELTEQQVDNIVAGWENENETETIELFNLLIKLGDSKQLACAATISEKYDHKKDFEMYRIAYES